MLGLSPLGTKGHRVVSERADVDILSGVLWLTIGVGAGLLILVAAPFGAGERSSPELLNRFVLALLRSWR